MTKRGSSKAPPPPSVRLAEDDIIELVRSLAGQSQVDEALARLSARDPLSSWP